MVRPRITVAELPKGTRVRPHDHRSTSVLHRADVLVLAVPVQS